MSGSVARNMSGLRVRDRNTVKPGTLVTGDPEDEINDNCVSFEGMKLQIPADGARHYYVKVAVVRVYRYVDGALGIFHGPRKLAGYDAQGNLPIQELEQAA